jgi:hypothetical protein
MDGHRVRLPVFLGRRPREAGDAALADFYRALLRAIGAADLRHGSWRLLERTGWPDNPTFASVVAWSWEKDGQSHVAAVNLSAAPAQARVRFPWPELAGRRWRLRDVLACENYDRDGSEMVDPGLYVNLRPWGFHFFAVEGPR